MKPCYITIEIQEPALPPPQFLQLRARAHAAQVLSYLPEWVAKRWGVPLSWMGSILPGAPPEPLFPLVTARVRCLDRDSKVHAVFYGDECVLGAQALAALDLLMLPSEGVVIANPRPRSACR